jgi:hypothetical protein
MTNIARRGLNDRKEPSMTNGIRRDTAAPRQAFDCYFDSRSFIAFDCYRNALMAGLPEAKAMIRIACVKSNQWFLLRSIGLIKYSSAAQML